MTDACLSARDVSVGLRAVTEPRSIVDSVSLELQPGQILGLAGESGCGKTTLALALCGFFAPGTRPTSGSVMIGQTDVLRAPTRELQRLWGSRIAYLPQNAATALNPARSIAHHLTEPLRIHRRLSKSTALARSVELLERVGLPNPEAALRRHPHQFSGGQQQRIALAMALSCEPEVLVLDEPTTGLDVVTQSRVNQLITALVHDIGTSTLYVSHDLAQLATVADRLAVMYAGQIAELGPTAEIYFRPQHPYSAALLRAVPQIHSDTAPAGLGGRPPQSAVAGCCSFANRCAYAEPECQTTIDVVELTSAHRVRCIRPGIANENSTAPLTRRRSVSHNGGIVLEVRELQANYGHARRSVTALKDVSLTVTRGTTVGVVGESGSGKSTLLRCLAGIMTPASGDILLDGQRLPYGLRQRQRDTARRMQLVFQNPDASLNPRHTVRDLVEHPLRLLRPELDNRVRDARVLSLMADLGLPDELLDRRPDALSGGQRQRVALGRALVTEPEVLLCDEVTSALDVSVQASIVEMLMSLCRERQVSLVFVTHDLGLLRGIADDIVVLRHGAIVERSPAAHFYENPTSDYARELLSAVPRPAAEPTMA